MNVNLKVQAICGAKWLTLSTAISLGLQFLQLIILTKLLNPADFGLMAMTMVVIGFAQVYTDMGVGNAIIYKQDATKEQLASLYWLNVAAGFCVFLVVLLLNPLVAKFYHEPRIREILFYASLVFLIIPFGQQFQILLQKELKFKEIALIDIAGAFSSMLVSSILAFWGFGVYALVVATIVSNGLRTLFFVINGFKKWRPPLHFMWSDLRGYLAFGFFQIGERTVNYLTSNIDGLLIGRFLGPTVLGVYNLASQFVSYPVQRINPILTRVAFPIFAKKQNDDIALSDGYIKMSRMLAYISFPLLIGLIAVAPIAIPMLCGVRWNAAIPIVRILAIVGIFKVICNPSGSILLAKGKANIGFYWNIFAVIMSIVVSLLVIKHGIIALSIAYALMYVVHVFALTVILKVVINLNVKKYLLGFMQPLFLSLAVGLIMFLLTVVMPKFVSFLR